MRIATTATWARTGAATRPHRATSGVPGGHRSVHYYYGPTYAYEYPWYEWRHLNIPDWYAPYDYDPYGVCTTYYYLYDGAYYCYLAY